MSDTQARQPSGTPVGGQFTRSTHPEPDVTLQGPAVALEAVASAIESRYGRSAAREVRAAKPVYAPELAEFGDRLPTLSDTDFVDEAASAIYESASTARFNGFEHLHARASMAYAESRRRHQAAGHDPACRGSNLYDRAYNRAVTDAGQGGLRTRPESCTCGATS